MLTKIRLGFASFLVVLVILFYFDLIQTQRVQIMEMLVLGFAIFLYGARYCWKLILHFAKLF